MKITKQDIENAIHKVDLIQHPYILFVNPSEEDKFKEALKGTEFEEKVIVQPDSVVEVGKAIIMDRKKLEDWYAPEVKFDFESDKTWANNSFGYTYLGVECISRKSVTLNNPCKDCSEKTWCGGFACKEAREYLDNKNKVNRSEQ